jgi:predicted DNA-binding protein with PD1-like motif
MEHSWSGRELLIRLEAGEEVVSSITGACAREGLRSGLVSGIGAVRKAEIGHYDTSRNSYDTRKLEGMFEIASLTGNIAVMDGKTVAHLHICLGAKDFSTLSGHLMSAEANPTCEIAILPYGSGVERARDGKTGLSLQHFSRRSP